jgi:hypothetical protein
MVDSTNVERPVDDQLAEFSSLLELEDVRFTRWTGEILREPDDDFELASADIRGLYRLRGSLFQCRWAVDFPIQAADGEEVATIGVTLVQSFSVAEGNVPGRDVIATYMRFQAFELAMPYIREAIQSMGSRLGIGSIVVGLHRDELSPHSATFRIARFPFGFPRRRAKRIANRQG